MRPSRSLCVFAGSSPGNDPALLEAASSLGRALVARGYGLVYGGATIGLDGARGGYGARGGRSGHRRHAGFSRCARDRAPGPDGTEDHHLDARTQGHHGVLAEGFIALPGGFGTLEEFFEVITWAQLGLHTKPCGLLNVNGYYDSLLRFLDTAVENRLLRKEHRDMVLVAPKADALLDRMQAYAAPALTKWIDTSRT